MRVRWFQSFCGGLRLDSDLVTVMELNLREAKERE
jgi:hypothetical protein